MKLVNHQYSVKWVMKNIIFAAVIQEQKLL